MSRLGHEMGRTCEDLLKQTGVIVQFWQTDDGGMRQPADVDDWDRSFRSDDFQMPNDEPVEEF